MNWFYISNYNVSTNVKNIHIFAIQINFTFLTSPIACLVSGLKNLFAKENQVFN